MALTHEQIRSEIRSLVEQSLDDFTRRLGSLRAPDEKITEVLAGMGLPDFAEAWEAYAEEEDDG